MDVLLAHQLFKPVLLKYAHNIELWRFHRRAGRDKAGHRFSFIFYAREATATAILNNLAENPLIPVDKKIRHRMKDIFFIIKIL